MNLNLGAIVTGFTDVPTSTDPGLPCIDSGGPLLPGQSYCDGYGPYSCAGQGLVWDTVNYVCDTSGNVQAALAGASVTPPGTGISNTTMLLIAAAAIAAYFFLGGQH